MKIIFSLIFLSLSLLSETINEQIHALADATPQERVALMNDIKEQLISMNEEARNKTLGALQAKLQAKEEETPAENHEMGHNKDSQTHENQSMHSEHEMHGEMMEHNQENFQEMSEHQHDAERGTGEQNSNQGMRDQEGQNNQEGKMP